MDLRQRDPFERKFGELIVRFRSLGLLAVLIMLVWQNITKAKILANAWQTISSQLKMSFDFVLTSEFQVSSLLNVWGQQHLVFTSFFLVLLLVVLIKKQWSGLVSLLLSFCVITLAYIYSGSCSDHIVWVVPAVGFVLAVFAKIAKFSWGTYLGVWLLGMSISLIQLSLLGSQFGVSQYTGSSYWMVSLLVIAGFVMAQQIWRLHVHTHGAQISGGAGVIMQWYLKEFRATILGWSIVLLLILLTFIPGFEVSLVFSLYYLMAAFQIAVLHTIILPMILNILGYFPSKTK